MRLLLMQLPWRFIVAMAITALALQLAYDLSGEARYFADRTFVWPIERMLRSMW
jgi:hypothetical protein